jgi:thymidylate synthase (FAD)
MSHTDTTPLTYREEALTIQWSTAEELKGKEFKVLNGEGSVEFIDVMGSDFRILDAARTTSQVSDKYDETKDRNLIRYLLRHRHTTPFEFAEICFKIRMPMDAHRQMVRHRTANLNEYSTRYSEAIDEMQTTPPDKWRLQAKTNRQGSSGEHVSEWPEGVEDNLIQIFGKERAAELTPGGYLSEQESILQQQARDVYIERLKYGVAKEQARKDLPLSNLTEYYWKMDLHNLMHFLSLRMDSHAQLEIREYATVIGDEIVAKLFPWTWEAFVDYRLEGMFLTKKDVAVLQEYLRTVRSENAFEPLEEEEFVGSPDRQHLEWARLKQCRERDECVAKLRRLGVVE